MKWMHIIIAAAIFVACSSARQNMQKGAKANKEWISLFDGKTMNGWQANENGETFTIQENAIKVHGKISHLFYTGDVMAHDFKNFEFSAMVKTLPGSNSGIYFHTTFKEKGWPSKGYEVQVNNSHTDWRRTGSLYAVEDVRAQLVPDNTWYKESIKVEGKRIRISINDSTVVDYTEPEGIETTKGRAEKRLTRGTFALQGHDPNSTVYFKDIRVKPLAD